MPPITSRANTTPTPHCQRKTASSPGHQAVRPLGGGGNARNVLIDPERPPQAASKRPTNRVRSAIDLAVGCHELDGLLESLTGQFGKLSGDARILEGQVVHLVAGDLREAADPPAAEVAIPVENHQRFRWR